MLCNICRLLPFFHLSRETKEQTRQSDKDKAAFGSVDINGCKLFQNLYRFPFGLENAMTLKIYRISFFIHHYWIGKLSMYLTDDIRPCRINTTWEHGPNKSVNSLSTKLQTGSRKRQVNSGNMQHCRPHKKKVKLYNTVLF